MDSTLETIAVTVAAGGAGDRLDRALAAALPGFSRARLQSLIRDGRVTVGGRTIMEPKFRVNAGDEVQLAPPVPAPAAPRPQPIALDIRYEDADIVVVDKPAGLVVHPGAGTPDGTLVNALLHHCADSLSGIGGVMRPGIVHRLDKDTSGLIVVAKHDAAHRALAAQFADHGRTGVMERGYLALVWGMPERIRGVVDAPLARSPANPQKMAVRKGGRDAVTRYEVLAAYAGETAPAVASLLACRLETGRTHQIRVHMAHAGHPLLGDSVYGAGMLSKAALLAPPARSALAALARQALHARLLQLAHPRTGETLRFESGPPADMAKLLAELAGT